MRRVIIAAAITFFGTYIIQAQGDQVPENWFHLDLKKDGYPGISTQQTYEELLRGKTGRKIIVAILDSGVDYEHEDLKDVMWVNEDEIPDNGIDDDKNGYIDDIHGWNFIGNKNGKNVEYDNLEMTRLFAKYKKQFEGKDPKSLSKKEKEYYDDYIEFGKVIEEKKASIKPELENLTIFNDLLNLLESTLKKEEITKEDLEKLKTDDPMLGQVAPIVLNMMKESGQSYPEFKKGFVDYFNYLNGQQYYYDTDLDTRKIVGDNYDNPYEIGYGNNDVRGPDAEHGTHVAGTVAAVRGNGIGMDGVASNVEIMSVRVVPHGDERDKDVANAIKYAVDNGASVINMSFGKGQSPRKKVVDEAVKYAQKKDVLLIHGAGNDSQENTAFNNYPNDKFEKAGLFSSKFAKNWIEVGAISYTDDENLVADFSNYSNSWVDVFAPGEKIYATIPGSKYEFLQGTSMASPIVAGVAAIIRSYFPELKAEQVKEVLLQSTSRPKKKVIKPGTGEMVQFSQLSTSGGIINSYNAVRLAARTKGKKKADKNDLVRP